MAKALKNTSMLSSLCLDLPHLAQYDHLEYASDMGLPHLLHLRLLILNSPLEHQQGICNYHILDRLDQVYYVRMLSYN